MASSLRRLVVCCLLFLPASLSAADAAAIDFRAPRHFRAGDRPWWIESADFNGDGSLDLAVLQQAERRVSVLLGDGSGRFGDPGGFPLDASAGSLGVADLNEDGHLDLVIVGSGTGTRVAFGKGDGTFTLPNTVSPAGGGFVATADFNHDGHVDLALSVGGGGVAILPGDGLGGFGQPRSLPTASFPQEIAAPDLNGDGWADLALACSGSGVVSVLLSDGQGGFGGLRDYATVPPNPTSIAAADLNGDGRLDLVAGSRQDARLSIFLNDGSGGFSPATSLDAGGYGAALDLADFDQDGHPDLAVSHGFGSVVNSGYASLSIFRGDGAGGFGPARRFQAGSVAISLVTGDFDRDGHQDVVTANYSGDDVAFLAGEGNGDLRYPPRVSLPFDPTAIAAQDFDLDGLLDLAVVNLDPPTIIVGEATGGAPEGPLDCPGGFPMQVSLFRGDGAGHYAPAGNFPVRCLPTTMAVGEFNRDGRPDVVTGNEGIADIFVNVPPSLSILLGDPAGGFAPSRDLQLAYVPASLAAGDFDQDGVSDLAVAPRDEGILYLYRGDGTGNLVFWRNLNAGSRIRSLRSVDLNDDGLVDLAATFPDIGYIGLFVNQRLFGFGGLALVTTVGRPGDLLAADLNEDRLPDFVVTPAPTPGSPGASIFVHLSNSPGVYQSPVAYFTVGVDPHAPTAEDFNQDGHLDVAVLAALGASVLAGDGAGRLGPPQQFGAGLLADFAATGQLDGDGLPDLAVAGRYPSAVSLMFNRTPVAPRLVLTFEPGLLRWSGFAGALGYDLVLGDLGTLRSTAGDFTAATRACLADDLAATSMPYAEDPPLAEGFWFLLRAATINGPGTYDTGSPGQSGSRDAEIAASPMACP